MNLFFCITKKFLLINWRQHTMFRARQVEYSMTYLIVMHDLRYA